MTFNLRNLRCYGKEKEVKAFYGTRAIETLQDIMAILNEDQLGNFCDFVEIQLPFNERTSVRNKLSYFASPIDLVPFFLDYCTLQCIQKAKSLAERHHICTFIEEVSYHYDRGDRYDDPSQSLSVDGVYYAMSAKDDSIMVPKYMFDYAALSDVYVLHHTYLFLKQQKFQGGINKVLTDVGQRLYTPHQVQEVFQSRDALGLQDADILTYLRSRSSAHVTEIALAF